jgi:hypothetical protein
VAFRITLSGLGAFTSIPKQISIKAGKSIAFFMVLHFVPHCADIFTKLLLLMLDNQFNRRSCIVSGYYYESVQLFKVNGGNCAGKTGFERSESEFDRKCKKQTRS